MDTERALLADMYPHCHSADVAAWLGKSLSSTFNAAFSAGLHKSAEYLASDAACRIERGRTDPRFVATQLKPGHATWNKGLRGVNGTSSTRFKPGNRTGCAAQRFRPIGGTSVWDGYLWRKVAETGVKNKDWSPAHVVVWIAAYGPIPAGHVVVFKDGKPITDPDHLTADKLECIDRAELARRNSAYTRFSPEVARLIQLRGALNRQINERSRALEAA